jgi:hypothetical protein
MGSAPAFAKTRFRKPSKNGWKPPPKVGDGGLAPFETAMRTPYAEEACPPSEGGWPVEKGDEPLI